MSSLEFVIKQRNYREENGEQLWEDVELAQCIAAPERMWEDAIEKEFGTLFDTEFKKIQVSNKNITREDFLDKIRKTITDHANIKPEMRRYAVVPLIVNTERNGDIKVNEAYIFLANPPSYERAKAKFSDKTIWADRVGG